MAAASLAFAAAAHALPTGGQVAAGQGAIAQSGATMTVNQATQKLSLNWQSFSIGQNESVNFVQPNASAIALNRVLGTDGSQILGRITANGQVFLLNPNGVLFGRTAQVNVGGIVASSLNLSDQDFLAGKYSFKGIGGSVINQGAITAAEGGYVALLGNQVSNEGVIIARLGTVAMGAGNQATLDFHGDNLVNLQVDQSAINAMAQNKQLIRADGGTVILSARAANALLATVVNNEGVIEAHSLTSRNGVIRLEGGNSGVVSVAGTLDASGAAGTTGGTIQVTGDHVGVGLNGVAARLDASGANGGGAIYVGGGWQGSGGIQQATGIFIAKTATLDASATDRGNGGTVVAWSDIHNPNSVTRAYGTFLAQGGVNGGDGGRIETSGHWLDTQGVKGDAHAPMGKGGMWLFDPFSVTISSVACAGGSFSAGTWTPTATGSTILNTDINTLLGGGTSVTITTGATGAEIGDITVGSAITKTTGAADVTLTLQAANSIVVDQSIGNTGGAGKLHVVLDADNDNGTRDGAGIILLNNDISTGGGNIQFGTGATMLINGVTTKVGGDVYVAGAGARTLTTNGGSVTVNGEMILANTSGLTINTTGTVNGNVTFGGLLNSGNTYASVTSLNSTWSSALAAAQTGTGSAVGNTYLATITSRLENAIASRTVNYQPSWLGARRVTGIGTNAVWRWVTGPEGLQDSGKGLGFFTQNGSDTTNGSGGTALNGGYSNWSGGEPNNFTGPNLTTETESVLQFTGNFGLWNDLSKTTAFLNYYVKETNLATSPLTINAGTGTVTFSGAVGGSKALSSLNVTAGTIAINGGAVTTEGAQTYTGAVTAGAATTLTAGSITTTSTVSAASNALTLTTDAITLGGNVSGTSTLTIQPRTAGTTIGISGGTGTLSLPASYFATNFVNGFSSITVGAASAGAITLGGATTFNDNTTFISNGNIALNAAVNAAGQTVTLTGTGAVSGNGNITATSLLLNGTGNYTLNTAAANNVGTLAATGVAGLSFTNGSALGIGTVGVTNGIFTSGTVSVATDSGDLTVAQNIATTDTTSSAITLNAGKAAAAGTATGGNIIVSGNPTISTGAGGRATFFTGGVAGSTGLAALVGAGTGRFRYNSDEAAANYTTALGSGNYAIYREQPAATITAASQTVTYGTVPTLTTSISGQKNGDTLGQVIGNAATIAVGGSSSTAGYVVGSHALTPYGATGGLGYAINYVNGTLTVLPVTLAVPGVNTSSFFSTRELPPVTANASLIVNQISSSPGMPGATNGMSSTSGGNSGQNTASQYANGTPQENPAAATNQNLLSPGIGMSGVLNIVDGGVRMPEGLASFTNDTGLQ